MAIDDPERYKQLSEAWRQVVAWREKVFAGYLTVLGGITYLVLQNPGELRRSVLFAAGILLAVIFQLLEIRTRNMANEYQYTGSLLEKPGGGCYTTMENARYQSSWLTFGFSVSLLTGFTIGICFAGLMRYAPPALPLLLAPYTNETSFVVGAVLMFLVAWAFERLGSRQRKRDKERRDSDKKRDETQVMSERTDGTA